MTPAVPHVRVVMPPGMRGKLTAARGARFFITLPGQDEVEANWLQEAVLRLAIDDAQRVELRLFGSLEIQHEDEP